MKILNLILILFLATSCAEMKISKTTNKEYQLSAYLWYQNSGEFRALCYQAYNLAKLKLDQDFIKTHSKKRAVVFDIDETVLDNSVSGAIEIRDNVSWNKDSFNKWVKLKSAVLIPGAKEFIDYAVSKNVEIIFISNRYVWQIEDTFENFVKVGLLTNKNNFYFLESGWSKESRRQEVIKKYDVVLYFGDNLHDFDKDWDGKASEERRKLVDLRSNEFGDRFIILPNPLYGDWEGALPKVKSRTDNLKTNF